jgi:uncharacterized protein YqgC (DUF456 family)
MLADGFAPLADLFLKLFVGAALGALIVSFVAAAVGARQATAVHRRMSATFWGCLGGFSVALIAGWIILDKADSLPGLLLGPLVGGATAYWVARSMAAGGNPSAEQARTADRLRD